MLTSFFEGRYGGYLALKDNEFRDTVLRKEQAILSETKVNAPTKKKRIVMGLYSTYFVEE